MTVAVQEVQKAQTQAISIIDNVNLQQVSATMQKIAQFQAVVQKTLKKDHDYGVIPGTGNKPTLLKPGAEKILMLMGLTSEYEVIERVQDYDRGFFAFTVKCTLSRGDTKVTEGVGHANTRERRYTSGKQQDPYTLANTVLKMAKKRAQVDAVLTVASLSEIFTQDLEDQLENGLENGYDSQKPKQRPQAQKTKNESTTEAQLKKLWAAAQKCGLDNEGLHEVARAKFNMPDLASVRDLSKNQVSELIDYIKKGTFEGKYVEDELPPDIENALRETGKTSAQG